MEIFLSQHKTPPRLNFHRGRFLAAFVLVAALTASVRLLVKFQPDSIVAAGFLLLPLVLLGALGAGRELLTLSLKELAFYSFAIVAAGLIWPGARLAVTTYEVSGFVALAAFMAFVFALAVALGILSAKLLASHDGET